VAARALAFAFMLSGCTLTTLLYGDDDTAPVAPPVTTNGVQADWKINIGTGESSFAPLNDNDAVGKVQGVQGGYHVWVSLLIDGATPEDVEVQIEVTSGGTLVSRAASNVTPRPDAPSTTRSILGERAFVNADTEGGILVRVLIVGNGAWASAERPLVVK
jgi:hypothetical protein